MNLHNARRYIGDRLIRTAKPHRILDPAQGPLIAVKLNILTRKTLGGFETDLDSRVFGNDGQIIRRPLRGGRSRRLRRRRRARLSLAGGHVPRRLPVLGPQCRTRGGEGGGVTPVPDIRVMRIGAGKGSRKPYMAGGRARPYLADWNGDGQVKRRGRRSVPP